MAASEGWTSVLVLTGVVTDPATVLPAPDVTLTSIADLPGVVAAALSGTESGRGQPDS
jgi:hypothetical protein